MTPRNDHQRFRNEDLVLQVSKAVDRSTWDEGQYEAFLDELCIDREYQKEAIRTTMRYLLGSECKNLRELARENFNDPGVLQQRYGTFTGMEHHLQLPDQLSASLDLATGTGKSFVLYGIAAILLAEGAVDRVLLLCPSNTIEAGLLEKFRALAGRAELHNLLPGHAKIDAPRIITARETITEGSICIENYHAILEHVGSSIRDSLKNKGQRTAVLNDEVHHVANESQAKEKKWKTFLTDPNYGFRYIIGVSGTCYIGNDYFSDVIYRYSLRQAMEERYVKDVQYVAEMPHSRNPDEKWQIIYNHHEETRRSLRRRRIRPLTIIVTNTQKRCGEVAEELKAFLQEIGNISPNEADEAVLTVFSGAPDVSKLATVDHPESKVEWVVAVSMLNEGWDVQRVFQIVPHEERAFNSKLLIAQVLGRGLRVPVGWHQEWGQPLVTVFNHEKWAPRIKHLVDEILELEKKLSSSIVVDSPHHFDLHNIDYKLEPTSAKKTMEGEYTFFAKGFVDLASESPAEDVSIEFERASTGERQKWETQIRHKTYSVREVAEQIYSRFEEAEDPEDPDAKKLEYTKKYPIEKLEKIVKKSLKMRGAKVATESMKQKFLQSIGTLHRKESEAVRYTPIEKRYYAISTKDRQVISASAAELKEQKTIFYTDKTRRTIVDEQIEFFDKVSERGSHYGCVLIENHHNFKAPLNFAIADSDNERKFINMLTEKKNIDSYDAWIKSSTMRFYEIDYSWKKGNKPKRGKFNPDFFIKARNLILVIEIKGEEELREPSDENRKKNEYAIKHFERVNAHLKKSKSPIRYAFHFLIERDFGEFFQALRDGKIENFRSALDVKLLEKE